MSLSTRLTDTVRQFAMGANVPRTWLEAAGLALALAGLGAGVVMAVRSGPRLRAVLAVAGIGFVLPLALALLHIEDRFYDRNLVYVLVPVAGLAATALIRLRAVPLVAYLALGLLASVWTASNWRYEQADWRTAAARMEKIDPGAAALVVPQSSLSLIPAGYYLGHGAATEPVAARRVWIVVEPDRAPHHRALGPAPLPAAAGAAAPGFTTERTLVVHGFRLVLLTASRPIAVDPAKAPGTAVFAPPL